MKKAWSQKEWNKIAKTANSLSSLVKKAKYDSSYFGAPVVVADLKTLRSIENLLRTLGVVEPYGLSGLVFMTKNESLLCGHDGSSINFVTFCRENKKDIKKWEMEERRKRQ